MFERYTEGARKAVFFARFEASQFGSPYIETEHLLLGLLREDRPLAERLSLSPAKIEAIREQIRERAPARKATSTSVDLPLSHECKRALDHAAKQAEHLKQKHICPVHLLLGISIEESSTAASILRTHGVGSSQLRDEARHAEQSAPAATPEPCPALEGVRDLTDAARQGGFGPLVGRERELERIVHILSRRTKNNPVLIGEAGIGKTAIVEGLARRIAEAEVPPAIAERRMIALDASVLAAPKQRIRSSSPFEELLDRLRDFACPVLFIRGLFNLAAAGPAWAVVEAMHALEPPLARGAIQCIATGSPQGLRATLEKAELLARHFEIVDVAPVGEEDAIRIVASLKTQFETFHDVTFADDAIPTAVYASGAFLAHRQLPDRAIDLIDEAAAAVKLRRENEPREIAEVRKRIRQLNRAMENAIARHEFGEARQHSDEEARERSNLEPLRQQYQPNEAASNTVTAQDIHAAAAARAGVPLEAVQRVLQQTGPGELQRIAGVLAAQVPPESREWVPFLAAYLARCSPSEAEALAQAIVSAKTPDPTKT